jgi:excisionase family DNA binding protein
VSTRKRPLTKDDLSRAFAGPAGAAHPAILTPAQLATLTGLSTKTIYDWLAQGRLDGCFRKRGKHVLIWRDRAIELLFNGRDWTDV